MSGWYASLSPQEVDRTEVRSGLEVYGPTAVQQRCPDGRLDADGRDLHLLMACIGTHALLLSPGAQRQSGAKGTFPETQVPRGSRNIHSSSCQQFIPASHHTQHQWE